MKRAFAISVLALLALPSIHALPTLVSYDLVNRAEWHDDFSLVSFNLTTAIHMEALFDCTTQNQTCQITPSPVNETFTIDYHVKVYALQDNGTYTVPMPQLLGDSDPQTIPLGTTGATLTITAHSHIKGTPQADNATANPATLTWTNWTTETTNLSEPSTLLSLNTTYRFYMTISFGYMGVEPFPVDSEPIEAEGVPSAEWVIPEYPVVALVLLACASTLALHALLRKARARAIPKS